MATLQALLKSIHFLWVAIAGEDDLLLSFQQRVEGVEEFLLAAVLAGEELDVVDHQRIDRAVRLLELVDGVVLQGTHHVTDESLAVHVGDPRARARCPDPVGNRMHEMGLAEADPAIEEQRVVGATRILGDLQCRRPRHLVALAFDEILEGELRVDPRTDRLRRLAAACRRTGRQLSLDDRTGGTEPASPAGSCGRRVLGPGAARRLRIRPAANLESHFDWLLRKLAGECLDAGQHVVPQPFDDESVGSVQAQPMPLLDRLHRPQPHAELRGRHFGLQRPQAVGPQPATRRHLAHPLDCSCHGGYPMSM